MPYIVITDVHGCIEELKELLGKLGFMFDSEYNCISFPLDTLLIDAGDQNDRGPDSATVLDLLMKLNKQGLCQSIRGNHTWKLQRYLRDDLAGAESAVRISHGLQGTIDQFNRRGREFKQEVYDFLCGLPTKFETPDLIVVHAAYKESLEGKKADEIHMYGDVDRKAGYDSSGFPVRLNNWKDQYTGNKTIVFGHIVYMNEPNIFITKQGTKIIGIDTGCAVGGKLTAYRFPEDEFVSVPAKGLYWGGS